MATENDVLFGRGRPIFNRPANRAYRNLTRAFYQQWEEAEEERQSQIAMEIVGAIKMMPEPGLPSGRFLKKVELNGVERIAESTDEEAVQKTLQLFKNIRTKLSEGRRKALKKIVELVQNVVRSRGNIQDVLSSQALVPAIQELFTFEANQEANQPTAPVDANGNLQGNPPVPVADTILIMPPGNRAIQAQAAVNNGRLQGIQPLAPAENNLIIPPENQAPARAENNMTFQARQGSSSYSNAPSIDSAEVARLNHAVKSDKDDESGTTPLPWGGVGHGLIGDAEWLEVFASAGVETNDILTAEQSALSSVIMAGLSFEDESRMGEMEFIQDAQIQGQGSFTGTMLHGKPHGVGFEIHASGWIECGTWKNGILGDQACIIYENEADQSVKGSVIGAGLSFADKTNVGELVFVKKKQILRKDKVVKGEYTGTMLRGKQHGVGFMLYSDGNIACGGWKYGTLEGQACIFYKNKNVCYGTFERHKKHGRAVLVYANQAKYVGEYFQDKKHGKGIYTDSLGNVYNGDFRQNTFQGLGIKQHANDGDEVFAIFNNWNIEKVIKRKPRKSTNTVDDNETMKPPPSKRSKPNTEERRS